MCDALNSICSSTNIGKQNVVYPCNRILLSHEKEQSTDICYYLDEPGKQQAELKKLHARCMIPFI
jgi:uncharacterized protein (DUF1778 family)